MRVKKEKVIGLVGDIYFDGATEPRNPGGAMGYGIVVKQDHQTVYVNSWFVKDNPKNTNNIAEYLAFIEALNYLKQTGGRARIYGDSMMVVKQMNKDWGIKNGMYTPYAHKAAKLLKEVSDQVVSINWIPREENYEADAASKEQLSSNNISITKRN